MLCRTLEIPEMCHIAASPLFTDSILRGMEFMSGVLPAYVLDRLSKADSIQHKFLTLVLPFKQSGVRELKFFCFGFHEVEHGNGRDACKQRDRQERGEQENLLDLKRLNHLVTTMGTGIEYRAYGIEAGLLAKSRSGECDVLDAEPIAGATTGLDACPSLLTGCVVLATQFITHPL